MDKLMVTMALLFFLIVLVALEGNKRKRKRISQVLDDMFEGDEELMMSLTKPAPYMTQDRKRRRVVGEWYVKPRSLAWWDSFVMQWEPARFRQFFRISKATFAMLCQKLAPLIQKQVTRFKEPVPVDKRVAVTICRLATNSTYLFISELLSVAPQTISDIVPEVCAAIITVFSDVIAYPRGAELQKVIAGFQAMQGLPNCCGAVDGSHVNIRRPAGSAGHDYFDRTRNYSILLLGTVGPDMKFLDINVGWPGSVHDTRVFKNSDLYSKGMAGTLLDAPAVTVNNIQLQPYILGDSGYPLLPWCIIPYPERRITRRQKKFNFYHSSTRMTVERAFGLLKGVWRILDGEVFAKVPIAVDVTQACCILHNILIDSGEEVDQTLLLQDVRTFNTGYGSSSSAPTASEVRDALLEAVVD